MATGRDPDTQAHDISLQDGNHDGDDHKTDHMEYAYEGSIADRPHAQEGTDQETDATAGEADTSAGDSKNRDTSGKFRPPQTVFEDNIP